jgi:transcription elongation factor Elf1
VAVLEPAKAFSRETEWAQVPCPYCGEELEVLVQADEDGQTRYEDCSVCCQSVVLHITWDDGDIQVEADRA